MSFEIHKQAWSLNLFCGLIKFDIAHQQSSRQSYKMALGFIFSLEFLCVKCVYEIMFLNIMNDLFNV